MKIEYKKTLLLVEDDIIIAMGIQKDLEKYGYNVLTANTGEKAVTTIKENYDIDGILMDIDLGRGIDGTEAAMIIMKERNIPIIFMSSHTEPEIVEKTEKITSYGYVVKNSAITVLDASIKMAFKLFEAKINEKEKEEFLREAYEYNEQIIQGAQEGIIVYDTDLRYRVWNPFMEKITGFSADKVLGKYPLEVFPFLKESSVIERLEKALRGKSVMSIDFPYNVPETGKSGWITDSSAPLHNAKGEIIGVIGMVSDITEAKQVEQKLLFISKAVETVSVAIGISDAQGHHFYQNKATSDLFEYTTAEEMEAAGGGGVVVKDPLVAKEMFENIMRSKSWSGELEMVTKSGRVFPAYEYADSIEDSEGNIQGLIGVISDISERKQAEKEIKALSKFPSENPNPVLRISKEGSILYSNEASTSLLGVGGRKEGQSIPKKWLKIIQNVLDKGIKQEIDFESNDRIFLLSFIPVIESDYVNVYGLDITDRKQVENALKISELQFRTIFNEAPLGIALSDSFTGQYYKVNSLFAKIVGRTVKEMERIDWMRITYPDDIKTNLDNMELLNTGEISGFQIEKRYLHKDGTVVWANITTTPVSVEDNAPPRHLCMIEDITWRKQAEIQLLKNQHLLAKAQEMGTWELDIQKNILRWTDENYKIFGVPPGTEMTYELFLNCIHPDDRDYVHEQWSAALNNEPFDVEHRLIVNSEVKWVREQADIDFDAEGIPVIAIGFTQDITEQKHKQAALMESEAFFNAVVEDQPALIYRYTVDGTIVFVNNTLCEYKQKSSEELIGSNIFDVMNRENVENAKKHLTRLTSTNPVATHEHTEKSARGEIRWFQWTDRIVLSNTGEILGYQGIGYDITKRKRDEDEIKRQLLEKEIILKEVHHRIKNNFSTIGSILSLQAQWSTKSEVQSALNMAIGRVSSMQVLYEKLLLSEGYRTTSIKGYLNDLIDEIISLFSGNMKLILEKQIDDFQLDPKRLVPIGIIVNELLTNIMKYAFTGKDNGLIQITLKEDNGNATLTIQDNGNGLPEGFSLDAHKGFGLMLIKMLAQQLDGSFTIDNHIGTRNVIKFCL